jgi:hypothetical protein
VTLMLASGAVHAVIAAATGHAAASIVFGAAGIVARRLLPGATRPLPGSVRQHAAVVK